MPLNSFEIYGIASRCPQKWWKALFLKVLFDVFFWKMRKNKHIFAKLTFKIVHFIRFVWRALSSGALSYPDISGNIRVKSQFENVTSRQFSMKIAIFQWFLLIKTIKTCFDHKSAELAKKLESQFFPVTAWSVGEDVQFWTEKVTI